MQRKINDTVIYLRMGKTWWKNPTKWFSGHHSQNFTIITTNGSSKGIPSTLVTYSWTLAPIPNRTCSVVIVPIFDARLPSTWLTNCVDSSTRLQSPTKKVVSYKVLQFIPTMKIKKMLNHKTQRCTYTTTSSQELWTRTRTSSSVIICLNREISQCLCSLWTYWRPLK